MIGLPRTRGFSARNCQILLSNNFLPLTFVLVGANIAPLYQFKTGIVLAFLWLLFVLGSVVLSLSWRADAMVGAMPG